MGGGYTRGLPEQTHCAAQRALEEIGSRIGTAASRGAVTELEQGRISRSWQPSATASRWRPWPNPGFRMYRLVQHEWKGRDALAYLWAMHPAIAGGSVRPVQAVSPRVTQSPPSPCQATRSLVVTTPLTTAPGAQKALSC